MKRVIFSFLVIGCSFFLSHAEYKMHIWSSDGSTSSFLVSNVDSVTFTRVEEPSQEVESVMKSDAKTLAKKLHVGINIGNTMESTDMTDSWCPNGETCWGAKKITPKLISQYKAAGFNAIRIPCQWYDFIESGSSSYIIKDTWMNRVKEVVDYVVAEDLYAVLNIHWDGGWLEENCTTAKKEEVNKIQAALWQQIATVFKDYDEHLLFASANEPNVDDNSQAEVLKSYHQTFVNTVRATGGNNALRNLIIQGPRTDIDKCLELNDVIPTDVVEGRMMYEVHFYPYTYALMETDADWGSVQYFWGDTDDFREVVINGVNRSVGSNGWCNEAYVDKQFKALKEKFVVGKGMPIILGEYCVMDRDLTNLGNHTTGESYQNLYDRSRAYYYEYVNRAAKNNGIVPFLWETPGNIFDRGESSSDDDCSVVEGRQVLLDGIMKGAAEGQYPF